MHFKNQLVIAGLPILVELVMERLAAFARVFAAMKLLAVRFEDKPACVVIGGTYQTEMTFDAGTPGTVGTAFFTTAFAAARYFSSNIGGSVSTSPILSKPWPESSGGNSFSVSKSIPIKSRIVLRYSTRLSRRTVTRPGSGFFWSVAKTAALIHSSICFFCRSVGWGFWGGGIRSARKFFNAFHQRSRSSRRT